MDVFLPRAVKKTRTRQAYGRAGVPEHAIRALEPTSRPKLLLIVRYG